MRQDEPWQFGRRAMIWSLVVMHLWGFILIFSVFNENDSDSIEDMFSAILWGIGWLLAVIVGGKAWKDFVPVRWGSGDEQRTVRTERVETVEKIEKEGEAIE